MQNATSIINKLQNQLRTVFPNARKADTKISIKNNTITILWQNHLIMSYLKPHLLAYSTLENGWATSITVDDIPLYHISSFPMTRNVDDSLHRTIMESIAMTYEEKLPFEKYAEVYEEQLAWHENKNDIDELYVAKFQQILLDVLTKVQSKVKINSLDYFKLRMMILASKQLQVDKIKNYLIETEKQYNTVTIPTITKYIQKNIVNDLYHDIEYPLNVLTSILEDSVYAKEKYFTDIRKETIELLATPELDIVSKIIDVGVANPIYTEHAFVCQDKIYYRTVLESVVTSYLEDKYGAMRNFDANLDTFYNLLVKYFTSVYHSTDTMKWVEIINLTPFLNKVTLGYGLQEFISNNIPINDKAVTSLGKLLHPLTIKAFEKYVPIVDTHFSPTSSDKTKNTVATGCEIIEYLDNENKISQQTFHKLADVLANDTKKLKTVTTNVVISLLNTYTALNVQKQKEYTLAERKKEVEELLAHYQLDTLYKSISKNTGFQNMFANRMYLNKVQHIVTNLDKYIYILQTDDYIVYYNNDLEEYVYDSIVVRVVFSRANKTRIVYHASIFAQNKLVTNKMYGDNMLCRTTDVSQELVDIVSTYHRFIVVEQREVLNNNYQNKLRKQRIMYSYQSKTPKHHKHTLQQDSLGIVYQKYVVNGLEVMNIIASNAIYTIYTEANNHSSQKFELAGVLVSKQPDLQTSPTIFKVNSPEIMQPQRYFGQLFNIANDLRYKI